MSKINEPQHNHPDQLDASESVNPTPETVTSDAAEITQDLQRVQAEFMNYKRRAEDEKSELLNFAKNRIVREFLAVRDNLDRELNNRPANIDKTWAASIDSIRQHFDQVLKSLGVERFTAVGASFDPHLHEAISHDGNGDTVTEEVQAGYKLGDIVLRHAMVKVGQHKTDHKKGDK